MLKVKNGMENSLMNLIMKFMRAVAVEHIGNFSDLEIQLLCGVESWRHTMPTTNYRPTLCVCA